MKKILAVSLCAIMAVSAARADIASVEYVDEQITGASSAINTTINTLTQTVGTKAAQADLTALQNTVTTNENDIEGKVSALSQTVTDNKATADKTQQDLDTLEATVAGLQGTGEAAAATKGELNALGGRVDDAEGEIDALQASLATGGDTQKAIAAAQTQADKGVADAAAAQAAASAAQATADKAVVANTAITAGTATKITYDAKGLVTKGEALTATDIPTIGQDKVSGLTAALSGKQATISDLATIRSGAASGATAVQPSAISDMQTKTNMKKSSKADAGTDNTVYPSVAYMMDTINNTQSEIGGDIADINATLSGKQATLTGTNVTSTGNGNVVTAVTAANGVVTVTKGTTLGSLATKSTVTSADITDGTIATADIADGAVTTAKIKDANVTTAKIADAAVTVAKTTGLYGVIPSGSQGNTAATAFIWVE